MSKRLSLVLAVAGALGLVLFLLQRANDAKLRALESELHSVSSAGQEATAAAERAERVVPALVRQMAAPQPSPAAAPPSSAPAPDPSGASTDDPTGVERARAFREKEAAYLEAAYQHQNVDAAWASPSRTAISNAITPQLGTSTLESIDCRANLCKASFSHVDAEGYTGFVDRFVANARDVWKWAIQLHRDPTVEGEAGVRNAIYFAREGTEFPRPQP